MSDIELLNEIKLFSTLIIPLLALYLLLFLSVHSRRYFRLFIRNKIIVFTQREIKEIRSEIDSICCKSGLKLQKEDNTFSEDQKTAITKIFSLYNEIAVGITAGLYDERYVQIVLGYEMLDFYNDFYKMIVFSSNVHIERWVDRYRPLELLLRKWNRNDAPLSNENWGRYK